MIASHSSHRIHCIAAVCQGCNFATCTHVMKARLCADINKATDTNSHTA